MSGYPADSAAGSWNPENDFNTYYNYQANYPDYPNSDEEGEGSMTCFRGETNGDYTDQTIPQDDDDDGDEEEKDEEDNDDDEGSESDDNEVDYGDECDDSEMNADNDYWRRQNGSWADDDDYYGSDEDDCF